MTCTYCRLSGIIYKGHCANCRAKYAHHPMIAHAYDVVTVEPSRSSFGKWAIRYSPSSMMFFWEKSKADQWASTYNASQVSA